MDGILENLSHDNIFTSGINSPSMKTVAVAVATAIGAWGGFPTPPKKIQDFFDDNEIVRYILVWILIWQGGSDQNWKLATVVTLVLYGVAHLVKEKDEDDKPTLEDRVKTLEAK
jgi:hypothetical protein